MSRVKRKIGDRWFDLTGETVTIAGRSMEIFRVDINSNTEQVDKESDIETLFNIKLNKVTSFN